MWTSNKKKISEQKQKQEQNKSEIAFRNVGRFWWKLKIGEN